MIKQRLGFYAQRVRSGNARVMVESVTPPTPSRVGRRALIGASVLALALFLSACSTAGNGKLKASITNEATVLTIQLGANVKDGLAMDIDMERDEFGVSRIKVSGAGKGGIDRKPGHDATADIAGKVVRGAVAGAKMGFAP